MRTIYFECLAGASGDMIMSSLADLLPDPNIFIKKIQDLKIPNVTFELDRASKCGINGIHITVKVHGDEEDNIEHCLKHSHSKLDAIHDVIDHLNVSQNVKKNANDIYDLIAEAESNVHKKPIDQIHFHEVGALDAIADIVGVCMLLEMLEPEQIISSPVRLGFGHVSCAHGIIPIPAPATEYLIRNIPSYAGDAEGEFCTPTGAAVLKYFTKNFKTMPLMTYENVGYGIGKNDYSIANIMRAYLGDAKDDLPEICELICNIDDITPEELGFASDILMENGALDAFVTPIVMKKNRSAFMLTCLCRNDESEIFAKLIMKHTTTLGVRQHLCSRYEMHSCTETISTEYGPVRVKYSEGYGIKKNKAEYDDIAKLAHDNNASISDVKKSLRL